jgi:hypothetical protein
MVGEIDQTIWIDGSWKLSDASKVELLEFVETLRHGKFVGVSMSDISISHNHLWVNNHLWASLKVDT